MKKESDFLKLNLNDFLRGLIIAVLTPIFIHVQEIIKTGTLNLNWEQIAIEAVGGFTAYILKNFLTPANKKGTEENNEEKTNN